VAASTALALSLTKGRPSLLSERLQEIAATFVEIRDHLLRIGLSPVITVLFTLRSKGTTMSPLLSLLLKARVTLFASSPAASFSKVVSGRLGRADAQRLAALVEPQYALFQFGPAHAQRASSALFLLAPAFEAAIIAVTAAQIERARGRAAGQHGEQAAQRMAA